MQDGFVMGIVERESLPGFRIDILIVDEELRLERRGSSVGRHFHELLQVLKGACKRRRTVTIRQQRETFMEKLAVYNPAAGKGLSTCRISERVQSKHLRTRACRQCFSPACTGTVAVLEHCVSVHTKARHSRTAMTVVNGPYFPSLDLLIDL